MLSDSRMTRIAVEAIRQRMKASDHSGGQLSVAIEGPCGSGKSTLANHLLEIFGDQANLIHMDDFFLPLELRTTDRLAEPGGNIDYVRFHEIGRASCGESVLI